MFSFIITETHANLFSSEFFENLMKLIIPLTRDSKNKVKIAATETLAVI